MEKCAKCNNPTEGELTFAEGGNSYNFCKFCSNLLNKMDRTHVLHMFLQPNSSKFKELPLTDVERNMLAAREKRAAGKSLWS